MSIPIYATLSLLAGGFMFKKNKIEDTKIIPEKNYDKGYYENLKESDKKQTLNPYHIEEKPEVKHMEPVGLIGNSNLDTAYPLIHKVEDTIEKRDNPMTHNNMVPFFGSSTKQNMEVNQRSKEGKLEIYTGQFKLDKNHKTEVSPLFAPVQQHTEQLSQPRHLDRYEVSLSQRNNELPFEQTRVGPGLAGGYTSAPSGGFHNRVRILPKTTEQRNVNPKMVNEGRIIRGKHRIDKRGTIGKTYRYGQELLVENFNGERNFTTVGSVTKPQARSDIILNFNNRNRLKRNVIGIANFEIKKHHDEIEKTYENRRNERSITEPRYTGDGHSMMNPLFEVKRHIAALLDKQRTTRRQATIYAKNQYGHMGAHHLKDPKSQGDAYNMRQNVNKEVIALGRQPTLSGMKLNKGRNNTIMQIKKIEGDRQRRLEFAPAPTYPAGRQPISKEQVTTYRNSLPAHNPRFDPSLTKTLDSNPLSQSVNSYA